MSSMAALLLATALLVSPRRSPRGLPRAARRRLPARVRAAAKAAVVIAAVPALGAVLSPAVAVVTAGGCALAWLRLRRRRRRQLRRIEGEALIAALEVLVGELRVGAHPVSAFTSAAAESAGAVRASLQAVASRARLGADVASGLRAAAANSPAPVYWDRLAVCWRLAAEHGLAMSALMQAARRDVIDRQRFSDRVEAGLAGARATAALLAGLPVLGILLGQLIGADPVRFLGGGGPGGWLLLVGAALLGAGVMWSDRIIDGQAG